MQVPRWLGGRQRRTVSPRSVDVAFTVAAGGLAAVSAALFVGQPIAGYRTGDGWMVALAVAQFLPLLGRRRFAVPMLLVTYAALGVYRWMDYRALPYEGVADLVLLYSVGAYGRPRHLLAAAAVLPVGTLLQLMDPPQYLEPVRVAGNLLIGVVALTLGRVVQRYRRELVARGAQLERERAEHDRTVSEALRQQRMVIARDLHDAVAQSLTHVVLEAGVARRALAGDSDRAAAALVDIARSGKEGLVELRRLLGVLRTDLSGSTDDDTLPTLSGLDDLAQRYERTGLTVTVRTEPASDQDPHPVPLSVQTAAFRIVQEALTNARKHGGPGSALVDVRRDGAELRVLVRSRGTPPTQPAPGFGHGLTGMRERAAAFGGRVDAGPDDDGTWLVSAALPLPDPPADVAAPDAKTATR